MKRKLLLAGAVIALFIMQGCLVTTSGSFNNGKMLRPGNARATVGHGKIITKAYEQVRINPWKAPYSPEYYDTTYSIMNEGVAVEDTTYLVSYKKVDVLLSTISFDFQLGISKKFPFGKGVNIGFHREHPGFSAKKRLSLIPTSELIVKCGLKDQPRERFVYNHNVLMGWQRGLFIDNGFFVEYAGGFETTRRKIPYFNVRMGFTPTDPSNKQEDLFDMLWDSNEHDSYFTYNDKRFFGRVCVGNTFLFKRKRPIVPEVFTEATFNVIHKKKVYPTFQLGLSWKSFFNAK